MKKCVCFSLIVILFLAIAGCKPKQQPIANYYQPVFDQSKKEYVKIPSNKGVELDTVVLIRSNLREEEVVFLDTVCFELELELPLGELIVPVELINEKPPTFDTLLVAKEYRYEKEFVNSLFPVNPDLLKMDKIDSALMVSGIKPGDFAAETFDTSSTSGLLESFNESRVMRRLASLPPYLTKSQILADTARDLFQADSLLTSLLVESPWRVGDSIPIYNEVSNYYFDSILYLTCDTVLVEVIDSSKIIPQLPFKKLSKEVITKVKLEEKFLIEETVTFKVFHPDEEDLFIDMVRVEGGDFKLGNNEFDEDERPATRLTVSKFLLSKFEVTNKLFCYFLNDIECDSAGESEGLKIIDLEHPATKINRDRFTGKFSAKVGCDSLPVVNVSWAGVQLFCKSYGGRLPSEAEWEYAAKGGVYAIRFYTDVNKTDFDYEYRFAGGNYMSDLGWFVDNSGGRVRIGGVLRPNALGLYDMCGNVWEWCYDKYDKDFYKRNGKSRDPMNLEGSTTRVNRGGCWSSDAQYCRICNRNYLNQFDYNQYLGFRYMREWK